MSEPVDAGARRLVATIALLLVVLAAVLVWLGLQARTLAASAGQAPSSAVATVTDGGDGSDGFRGALAPPLLTVPDVTLTSSHGGTFNPYDAREAPVTLYFNGFTRCPDICPATLATMAAALRTLDAAQREQVSVVFVTTDPAHDTAPEMARYLEQFDPGFVGVTGEPAELLQVTRALGLPDATRSGTVHSGQITAFTAGGKPAVAWTGDVRPADIAHDVALLLAR